MSDLLRAENLSAGYVTSAGLVQAVDDVTLTLREGEVLGIAGESGCGKSTLAALLARNINPPLRVTGGTLSMDGELADLSQALPRPQRGTLLSVLPQGAINAINPTVRVRDLAYDVMRAHEKGVTRKSARERAAERLGELGLPPRAVDQYPHELSGGMRQRVVAVISTLLNPRILIADEPSSALDVSSQQALVALLRDLLSREIIRGVVFITHDLPLMRTVADRVAIMYAGRLAELGQTDQMLNEPRHPYTRALVGSVLVPEPYVRRHRIEGIPGTPPDLADPPAGCRFHPRCTLADNKCLTDPPRVGDLESFAYCWRVAEAAQGQPVTPAAVARSGA
ncbi:ABC transporter ATP-binding protein [Deinococcus sp. AJ005]|uniref:ABC transporter ATP-binding protein n=1 Tax=Deinococcus sp. AJ005 TaxID=2652443 RepID=UPI00125CC145|nr:ABC transporter ATP-binding protein [Deinococcus sp. AJ005]QFP75281.1 ABC transporter ATP-binding protein [Deinococcus sp. AJ005]